MCISMASCACLLLSTCVFVCAASNVDTSFPLLKTGADRSLFGLSVAFHPDLKSDQYLLLVGAPRERAEPNVAANYTGGVYSCPITANQSDCRRMLLIKPDLNVSEDLIEDMWLGVSLASQGRPGGRVLACGHRFAKVYGASKLRHMIGRCYLRGNDLQYDDADLHWQNPDQVCSHLGDISGEVMCNMGISAAITQNEVIVGSPGSYQWQGNVHVSWMNPHVAFDTRRSSLDNLQRRNIYIGYSVSQARALLSQDDDTIVTGAPKDTKEDARGSVLLAVKHGGSLTVGQTLRGEQTGSYFGNAVVTSDLDDDGWSDLLVGAPFFFHRQQEVGGAVYVYMNAGGRVPSRPTLVLKGPAGSAFGMSLAAAGDLNQDGFQDFAVGAPFHGTGSVMIFSGSRDGVPTKPSQVIKGSSVSSRFTTFGFSLSAGLDVDGNKYPDLLVGSLDDTVALLRSRAVIHLNKAIRVSPNLVDISSCDFCIQVEVCFSVTPSTTETNPQNINVHFTVAADVTGLKPRLIFKDSGDGGYSGSVLVQRRRCKTLRVGLVTPIRDKVEPLVFSLNASLTHKLPKKQNVVQDLRPFPVLSHIHRPIRTQVHIQKACGSDNRCHSNLQMTAQFTDENHNPLSTWAGRQVWFYHGTVQRILLQVNVSNVPSPRRPAEDAHNAVLNISVPPSLTYSGVRTKGGVQEVRCCAEGSMAACELGNPFKSNRTVQVWIIFQPSQIPSGTSDIQTVLQMSTLSQQADLSPVLVSLAVNYSLDMSLTLSHQPGPAPFSGQVVGESAMRTTEDVGTLLVFALQVHVGRRPLGHLGNLELAFDWPSELSNGKRLLYLTEITVNGASEPRCVPPTDVINPLRLTLSEGERGQRGQRERRSPEEVWTAESPPVRHLQAKKSYELDCVHGAKCVHFVCPLLHVNNSASITLRARLWNSTMLEHYTDARKIVLRGRATLRLHTESTDVSMEGPSTQMEVHVYPDLQEQVDTSAPLWIIVVSVLAGLLLLAMICLLLRQCGFFTRRRAWCAATQHQGKLVLKDKETHVAQGAIFADNTPKRWVTWTATH
ncbi:integrin alpha-3-like isoform X2 [Entelurus aequoreus]|uniref:integrin alpha-3-like isoform X2 n=1 Tax=Entelurus aequoreus TaxID=161455 RepID=UPI002B1DBB29|nr:integrin alpha-3-like isoform X2 [Entelurus aequoreus]